MLSMPVALYVGSADSKAARISKIAMDFINKPANRRGMSNAAAAELAELLNKSAQAL